MRGSNGLRRFGSARCVVKLQGADTPGPGTACACSPCALVPPWFALAGSRCRAVSMPRAWNALAACATWATKIPPSPSTTPQEPMAGLPTRRLRSARSARSHKRQTARPPTSSRCLCQLDAGENGVQPVAEVCWRRDRAVCSPSRHFEQPLLPRANYRSGRLRSVTLRFRSGTSQGLAPAPRHAAQHQIPCHPGAAR